MVFVVAEVEFVKEVMSVVFESGVVTLALGLCPEIFCDKTKQTIKTMPTFFHASIVIDWFPLNKYILPKLRMCQSVETLVSALYTQRGRQKQEIGLSETLFRLSAIYSRSWEDLTSYSISFLLTRIYAE